MAFLELGAGNEFIVQVEELPDDLTRVRALLDNEQAPIDVWIDVTKAYLANGKPQQCEALLDKVVDMNEADLPALHLYDPAAKFPPREMLKLAQIQAYCFKAQMRLDEATMRGGNAPDSVLVNTANNLLQHAREIDNEEGMLVVMRGQIQMLQDNIPAAKQTFRRAKACKFNSVNASVAPFLALAQTFLLQREFREALKEYTEALSVAHHTEGANSIRLGIGICHMRLGDLNMARLAFERVLFLDDNSAEAFAGLAAVELLAPEGSVERFLELVTTAHRLDPQSSPVNTALAQFSLVRGDIMAAEAYAQVAVSTAIEKCSRAQALCVLARIMHAKGRTSSALSLYTESIQAHELPLAVYGYAQMLIEKGQDVNATTELEKVLKVASSDPDALLLMGQLLPHVTTGIPSQQRLDLLKEGAMHHMLNSSIQEVLGEVLAVAEPGSSASAFLRALDLRQKEFAAGGGPRPSSRLLSNTGVLEYRSKRFDKALMLMQAALDQLLQTGEDGPLWQDSVAILRFNIARCHEAQGAMQVAMEGYNAILEEHPDFVDCTLRLGYIHTATGKRAEAEELFKQCAALEDDKQEAWTALCMSKLHCSDWSPAKDYAKKLLECATTDESKSFAHVLHGNVYFGSAPTHKSEDTKKDPKMEEKRFTHLSSAARHYKQALEVQPGNIYAANGLGAVAGALGQLDAARTILSRLRESAALASGFVEVPDVWVNLGTLHLGRGEATDAARMYNAALARFYQNKDPKVSLWLARAYYDAKDYKNCKRALLKAIHSFPDDQALYFNLALTMQKNAEEVIQRPAKPGGELGSSREELEESSVALIQAAGLFKRLMSLPKAQVQSKGLKNINMHVGHCDKLSQSATRFINKVKAADEIRQKQVEEQEQRTQLMREAAELQRQMQVQTEQSIRAEQQAALAAKRKADKDRNLQWAEEQKITAAAKRGDSAKASKSRQKQKELEEQAQGQMEYEAQIAAVMGGVQASSSDEEYDEDAIAHDAAEAEAEERRALEGGYNSNDEKGTADVPEDGSPRKVSKKKSGKKRHRKEAVIEDPEADALADLGLGDDLEGDDAMPAEKKRAVLESDDE